MGKDEGKEKKPCKKDIDLEYPTWPWVDYKFYDVNFFEEVKKLLTKGMDPKSELLMFQLPLLTLYKSLAMLISTKSLILCYQKNKENNWKIYSGKFMAFAISQTMIYTCG